MEDDYLIIPEFLRKDYQEKELPDLHLNLKGEYFDQIKTGEKEFEYRLINKYWTKRLFERNYNNIIIKRGYPRKDDADKIIIRPYKGYKTIEIEHKHFGDLPVDVYAIRVNL